LALRLVAMLTAVAVTLAIADSAAQPSPSDHVIVPGVRIGAAELERGDQGALYRQLGEPNETQRRGDHEYYSYGSTAGELVVDFDLADDAPFEISTASPLYRTRDGLGVGRSDTAVRSALGQPLCQAGDGNGDAALVYDSIWFLTAGGKVTKISIRAHLSAEDFQAGPLRC
jgi:hypothetical protein